MKSFLCAMLLFVVIIVGTSIYSYALETSIEHLEGQVLEVNKHAQAEDWEQCQQSVDELLKEWEKTQRWLMAVVDHREIDLIHKTLYEVIGYCFVKNQDEILVKTGVLQMLLQHIPTNEELSLTNVL